MNMNDPLGEYELWISFLTDKDLNRLVVSSENNINYIFFIKIWWFI